MSRDCHCDRRDALHLRDSRWAWFHRQAGLRGISWRVYGFSLYAACVHILCVLWYLTVVPIASFTLSVPVEPGGVLWI